MSAVACVLEHERVTLGRWMAAVDVTEHDMRVIMLEGNGRAKVPGAYQVSKKP